MSKRYLNVAYEDRDLAKRLGAAWDPAVKKWYCCKGSALDKIYSWRPAAKAIKAPAITTQAIKSKTSKLPLDNSHVKPPVMTELPLFA